MGTLGLVKRFLPFFATLALGLFIASFFVDIGFTRFRGPGPYQRLRMENEQLKKDYLQLKNEHSHCHRMINLETGEETGEESVYQTIPYDAPMPPSPPKPFIPRAKR